MKKGLFIVFEGIDGSGEDTQVEKLYSAIKSLDKYQDILATHEPWKHGEIKRKLREDKDAYSDAEEMAELYIGDRTDHSYVLLRPNLDAGAIVLCSRYKMSTCAFQQTQGIPLDKLLKMHEHRGILNPDLTFFLDVPGNIAESRREKRGTPKEKFEQREFMDKVTANYWALYEMSLKNPELFGEVVKIDGNGLINEVAKDIYQEFLKVYNQWSQSD
jgi:dTMP kinase